MKNLYSLDLELSSSQYASILDASQTGLDITSNITIEAYIKLEQLPSTAGASFFIVAKWLTTGNQRSYELFINSSDNKLYFDFSQDGTGTDYSRYSMDTAFAAGDVGAWRHVAITAASASNTVVFYKDGSSVANTPTVQDATAIFNSTSPFYVGCRAVSGTPGEFFDGKINNLRIWNDVRTGTEINANKNKILTHVGIDNLVDSWYFSRNNHNSASGLNNLTASGSPTFSTDVPFTGTSPSFIPFL